MSCVRVSIFGVLLLPMAVFAQPEQPPEQSFAELLPAETIAYVETSAPTAAEVARAAQYRCLEDPALNQLLDRVLAEKSNFTQMAIPVGNGILRASMNIREPGLSFDLRFQQGKADYAMKVRGNLAFAWVGMKRASPQRGRRSKVSPDIVAAFTIVGDPLDAHRLIRGVLTAAAVVRGKAKRSLVADWKHSDVACTSCRLDGTRVHFGVVGKRLVLTSTRDRLIDIIDRSRARAGQSDTKSLADVPRHRNARSSTSGDGTITTLLDIDLHRVLEAIATAHGRQFSGLTRMAAMVGLGGLEGISSVTRVDGDGISGTTSILLSGPRSGISRLFAKQPPAKFGALAFAPKETLYVGCGHLDGKTVFRAFAEAVQPLVMMLLMEVHREVGLNLRDDLIHLVGPEVALIVASNHGVWPDIGLVIESSDAKRLEASILKLIRANLDVRHATIERTRIAGGEVSVLKIRDSGVPVAPTMGVVDGNLVLTLFPITYQRLAATKRGERPGLDQNRDYAALSKHIPSDAIGMSYLDVRRTIHIVYDTVVPILQAMPRGPGMPAAPMYEVPEARVFTDHLYGNIGWRTADDRGMHWHSKSSTDAGSLGLVMGAVTAGALFVSYDATASQTTARIVPIATATPVDAAARELSACISNVRRIRNQLRVYRKRSKPFPETLKELAGGWVNAKTLRVPGTDDAAYRYFGPKGNNGVLLAGRPNGPDGGICVLLTNLQMKRVSPADLRKTLRKTPGAPKRRDAPNRQDDSSSPGAPGKKK